MARTKKLTDPLYSPTNPTSEAAIRSQIDDSIQEVYDQSAKTGDTVNLIGNQTISDVKTFSSSPIVPTPTSATQVATKGYVDGVAISATIPLDSLTDDYLASAPGNIKPRVATLETDFATAQTDINNLETDVEIINTAVSDTGLVNAMVVNTAGTFDMAKNGNVTPFIIPLFTNTGTATLSIDGGAVTGIRKANDAGTLVVLEAGDIKKNVPTQFVLDTVSGFFVYAPKNGANIKNAQQIQVIWNDTNTTKDVTISPVDVNKSIVLINHMEDGTADANKSAVAGELINSTTIRLYKNTGFSSTRPINIQVVEFQNVKSKQTGIKTVAGAVFTEQTVAVTTFNTLKSILVSHHTTTAANKIWMITHFRIINSTTLGFMQENTTNYWQLIEFV